MSETHTSTHTHSYMNTHIHIYTHIWTHTHTLVYKHIHSPTLLTFWRQRSLLQVYTQFSINIQLWLHVYFSQCNFLCIILFASPSCPPFSVFHITPSPLAFNSKNCALFHVTVTGSWSVSPHRPNLTEGLSSRLPYWEVLWSLLEVGASKKSLGVHVFRRLWYMSVWQSLSLSYVYVYIWYIYFTYTHINRHTHTYLLTLQRPN